MMLFKLSLLLILVAVIFLLSGASESGESSGIKSPPVRIEQSNPTNAESDGSKNPPAPTIENNSPSATAQKNRSPKDPEPWPPLWSIVTGLVITGCASAIALWTLTFIKQRERPWLMLSNPKWEMAKDWSGGVISPVEWSIKNVGRGPAFLTQLATIVDVLKLPVPEKCPGYPVNQSSAKFIIPPEGMHSSTKNVVGVTQLQGIFNGTHCLIFYGRVI